MVQRLRETRRRPERIGGEPNPLTGILYCSDCGRKMYHKKGNTGRPDQPHHEYVCSSYRHYSRSCTCHYIRVVVIEKLILDAIKRVSQFVRNNETEFVERLRTASAIQQEEAVKDRKKKLTVSKRRIDEVSGLIKKLYESYAADKIPEKHFTELLSGYDTEHTKLEDEIKRLQSEIESYNTDTVRADKFIKLVKRHTEFNELSATLLNEFVEKVIVHEAKRIDGERTQEVEIFLNFIGKFDLSEQKIPQVEPLITTGSKNRKLRRFMTEEELQHEREIDHRYYAKKVAAKKVKEQAEREAILQGTSYAIANA